MAPIIEDVLKDSLYSSVELISINIDDETGQKTAREFGVRSIPTFILINDKNQVINTLIGTASDIQVREFLSKR
jgi:thioredoxin-like negative regulator of GroEL